MILGSKELLELVINGFEVVNKEGKKSRKSLVENLDERELVRPEGAGFDLRAGEIYRITGKEALLGIKDRHTPETELVAKYGTNNSYILRPGEFYLIKTMEKVNLPADINARFTPRSTLQRSALSFHCAAGGAGYSGELTFGVYNLGKVEFELELGARFAHVQFERTGENVRAYEGQWKDGRVSTEGKVERQI